MTSPPPPTDQVSSSFFNTSMSAASTSNWLQTLPMEAYAITGLVAACGLYLLRDFIFANKAPAKSAATPAKPTRPKATRNILEKLEQSNSKVAIFYGSQTGTAEDYSNRIAKEGKQRFGISCVVADIENYDMDRLDEFPSDCLAIFIMATYGEGEPTDNANDFYHMIIGQEEVSFSNGTFGPQDKPLEKLRYAIFGLGNRTYEHFNSVAIKMDSTLEQFGAKRVGELGLGDDDASLEDDFIGWKEPAWKHICEAMDVPYVSAGKVAAVSSLKVTEHASGELETALLHLGELYDKTVAVMGGKPTYDAKHPYCASVKVTKELFASGDRNCIHLEVDIEGSGIKYETGDHIGLWAVNPEEEVMKFAKAFGIADKLDTVVSVESLDTIQTKKPFPSPTTYASLLRFYVDICSSPSRQFLGDLVNYCHTDSIKEYVSSVANDTEKYSTEILARRFTLAEMYLYIQEKEKDAEDDKKMIIPFGLAIENLGRLLPRYYSISSSSKLHPNAVHVTASVLTFTPKDKPDRQVKGLFTNFLLSAHQLLSSSTTDSPYQFSSNKGEDGSSLSLTMPMYIRKSNFRLPKSPKVPVIMVGPGTGVAPFRGFLQERSHLAESGEEVGPTVLYYGCRRKDQDYMYADEWDAMLSKIPGSEMHTAFSRENDSKVYVQHLIAKNLKGLWDLIEVQKGTIYVCGDAKYMAKDVNQCFVTMAEEQGGLSNEDAIAYVKKLRSQSRYQEDVWS